MIDVSENFLYIHREPINIDTESIYQIKQNNDNLNYSLYHTDINQWLNRYTNLKIIIKKGNQDDDHFSYIYTDPFEFTYSCYSSDFLIYPFLNWKNTQELNKDYTSNTRVYRQLKFFIEGTFTRSSIICKLHKDNQQLYMNYYINKKIINNFLQGKKDYKIYIIKTILNRIISHNLKNKCETELNSILDILPQKYKLNEEDFSNIPNLNIELFNYQLQDIKWMNLVEQNVLEKNNIISYSYKPYINIQFDHNSVDISKPCLQLNLSNLYETDSNVTRKDILSKDDQNNTNYIYYYNELIQNNQEFNILKGIYTYFGGNLTNSVGLGKTIIALCHILKNKNNFDIFVNFQDDNLCNYFYKRGSNKGKTCCKQILNNSFYCKEHIHTPFIDKRKVYYHNLENFHIYEHIIQENSNIKINTNSNLVICPGHLSDQWSKEYYKQFADSSTLNGKRVLLVITQEQFANLTFGDILFSDIIITSYNFLNNNKILLNSSTNNLNFITKNIDDYLLIENKYGLLNSKDNLIKQFTNFKFNSIILDESHEIKNTHTKHVIHTLSSKFKWNITGTPFANGVKGFLDIISYISRGENYSMGDKYIQMIKSSSHLFRRNTKETVENEVKKNIITYTTKVLEFTDQERTIYDSYLKGHPDKNYNFLIRMCCHPEIYGETKDIIKNCKTFSEIQNALLDHNYLKMTKSLSIQKKLENTIKIKENSILNIFKEHNIHNIHNIHNVICDINIITPEIKTQLDHIRSELSIDKRNLTNEKKNYEIIKRVYDYLKNVIDNIKDSETCPICLDDTDINNLAITKCGHKLCWECINEYIDEMNSRDYGVKCPKCNMPISKDDIYKYKEDDTNHENVNNQDELIELINKIKSTKIGHIVNYIDKHLDKNDKCIIFSQWDEILNIIGDNLKNKHVYCKGTVYQKKKAIKDFTEDKDTNVILLSSKNAASGTNLTAANKIILVEPIYGTKKYRQDIENQSIGRSNRIGQKRPIEVIRFIIKDTVEEIVENDVDDSHKSDDNIESINTGVKFITL